MLCSSYGFANPSGADVVSGDVSMISSESSLLITQTSDKAIVNWQDFSISNNETTKFLQSSNDAVILNRVVSNSPSLIYGNLEANGKVYLINQNGIFIGPNGQISAMTFIASTLNVLDNEFLEGKDINFSNDSLNKIQNLGKINTSKEIYLIAKEIENEGSLTSENVNVIGTSDVLLYEKGNENFVVRKNTTGLITNNGTINAVQTVLKASSDNIYALAINQNGVINAKGIENKDGRIILSAETGKIEVSKDLNATSYEKGGEIDLLGEYVHVKENANLNTSSENDGGTILVGGDYQGKNENIQNAKYVYVEKGSTIDASSKVQGNGGKVILWSNEGTWFYGDIQAKGGSVSGDGGFVEISSKGLLVPSGSVNTKADNGKTGTLLFDPVDITITNANANIDTFPSPENYVFSGTPATIKAVSTGVGDSLEEFLALNNVTINTSSETGAFAGNGDITVTTGFSWSTPNKLTLVADRAISIQSAVVSSGTGAFTAMDFTAGNILIPPSSSYTGIDISANLLTTDGKIILKGFSGNGGDNFGVLIQNGTMSTSGIGDISIKGTGRGTVITIGSNGVQCNTCNILTTGSGKINIDGTSTTAGSIGLEIRAGAQISTNSNDLTLTGTTSGGSQGLIIYSFGGECDVFTQSGNILIDGTSNGLYGVDLETYGNDINIYSVSGSITIDGTANLFTGVNTNRAALGGVTNIYTGNNLVTITGVGDGGNPGLNFNYVLIGSPSQTGNIIIEGEGINIASTASITGTGALTLEPISPSSSIGLLGGAGDFNLTAAELDRITDGFSNIIIGRSNGDHVITVGTGSESYSFNDPLVLNGKTIDLNADLTSGGSGANNITFNIGLVSAGTLNLYKNVTLTSGNLLINGGAVDDTFNIITTTAQKALLNGIGGTNTLVGPNIDNTWNITGNDAGNLAGSSFLVFSNIQNLTGGTQSDIFILSDQKGISGTVDGGNSPIPVNTLDYSKYTTPVVVDLIGGTATNIGAILNIQEVIFPLPPSGVNSTLVSAYITDIILAYDLKVFADNNTYRFYMLRDLLEVLYPDDYFFNFDIYKKLKKKIIY
jgi:filamentous hemagglutinin family protein